MRKQVAKIIANNYVTVAVSEDAELARDYVEMLKEHEIPARFVINDQVVQNAGVAILVDEEFIEAARSLINGRNSGPDFYSDKELDDVTENISEMEE